MASSKVKVTNTVKITTFFSPKTGQVGMQEVKRIAYVPKGSLKHRQAEAIKLIQEKCDNGEISHTCSEIAARLVKEVKPRQTPKVARKRREYITAPYPAKFNFKPTLQTDYNWLKLLADMNKNQEKFALDTKYQKDTLWDKTKEAFTNFYIKWPREALQEDVICRFIRQTMRSMQIWYERYTNKECTLDKEALAAFLDTEIAKTKAMLKDGSRECPKSR